MEDINNVAVEVKNGEMDEEEIILFILWVLKESVESLDI